MNGGKEENRGRLGRGFLQLFVTIKTGLARQGCRAGEREKEKDLGDENEMKWRLAAAHQQSGEKGEKRELQTPQKLRVTERRILGTDQADAGAEGQVKSFWGGRRVGDCLKPCQCSSVRESADVPV